MKAPICFGNGLAVLLLSGSLASATNFITPVLKQPYPIAPSAYTSPGFYYVGPYGMVYGPSYYFYPPFPPHVGPADPSVAGQGVFAKMMCAPMPNAFQLQQARLTSQSTPQGMGQGGMGPGGMGPGGMGPGGMGMGPGGMGMVPGGMGPGGGMALVQTPRGPCWIPMLPQPPNQMPQTPIPPSDFPQMPIPPSDFPQAGGAPRPMAYPTHPFVRSPRDFFMWNEVMEETRTREARPVLVP